MNHVVKKQQGFTIIELTLAMTFISFLLLAIALTIIQIGAIYNKGTTVKEINQSSRDMNDDLRRNISAASSLTLATDYVLTPSAAAPAGGRLCLGSYSYIWNYAKAIANGDSNLAQYLNAPDGSRPSEAIRFVRVPDPARSYCAKSGTGALAYRDIRSIDVPQARELLKPGDHELGMHNFSFITPIPASATDPATGQQMYSISYRVGTSKIPALNADQSACLAPGVANADPLYCNIQQFSLVVRAGNKVN
jgi:type II secretory pathway pseudopilin PulG